MMASGQPPPPPSTGSGRGTALAEDARCPLLSSLPSQGKGEHAFLLISGRKWRLPQPPWTMRWGRKLGAEGLPDKTGSLTLLLCQLWKLFPHSRLLHGKTEIAS